MSPAQINSPIQKESGTWIHSSTTVHTHVYAHTHTHTHTHTQKEMDYLSVSDVMISDQGKRTNSLGFAQTDCHTCASLSEKCDRRRPQCSACLGEGRRCGGFAMPLSWDPRRMWSDNPSVVCISKDLPNEEIITDSSPKSVPTALAVRSDSPKRFRFVKGALRPKKRRRVNSPKEQASQSVVTENSAVTPEVVLKPAAQKLEIFEDHQRGNTLAGLGMFELYYPCNVSSLHVPHNFFPRATRRTPF